MKRVTPKIDTIDEVLGYGARKGAMHLYTTDEKLKGNVFLLDKHSQKESINFGSCSYLGLEFDERLKRGAIEAINNYGTQFSSSRAYVSTKHYAELEALFSRIFDAHAIVTPTTTLGHMGAIPTLVEDKDAIILDHQVHNSVQTATNIVKTRGVYTELLRHNNMNLLEERIQALRSKYNRIWYMVDGIYSMYGDATPVDDVFRLMEKYPELHYYVDDAHGMSCYGKNGGGYVLSKKPMHERMVIVTSLAKAFATGGGVAVFHNAELARRFRTTGGPINFSGPMQPGALGAAIASAKIHLSPEITEMQNKLKENVKFANLAVKKYNLPLIAESDSPIFFVGVSLPKIAYSIINKMMDRGYYMNAGIFPAVPIKNTGVRFTVTRLHTFKQIESMVENLAECHAQVLKEENFSMEQIYKAFKMKAPMEQKLDEMIVSAEKQSALKVQHESTILDINKEEWNSLLGERGTYDWNGLNYLENSFKDNKEHENNWEFDYLLIKDQNNKPVLATFLTTATWKDDMLSPEGVSVQVEAKRKAMNDPYYLTSKIVCMGSLLTEGDHLYVDRTSPYWKEAMSILLDKMTTLQEQRNATGTMIRDLAQGDDEMNSFLMDNGYFKIGMPDTHTVDINWTNKEEFIERLTKWSKRHIRRDVFRHEDKYEVEVVNNASPAEIEHWYSLYRNVKGKSLLLNTFELPRKVFENMANNKNWEIITLKLKPEFDKRTERKPVVVVFSYVTAEKYNPMVIGIDYDFQEEHKCYKQALYRVLERAREQGKKVVNLGLSASIEKQKYGARPIQIVAYMQVKDNYSMEVVHAMNVMQPATI
jgi:7-keto-8-aminopelargonate synthetase-like enzyme